MTTTGLFYPLQITGAGDLQVASSLTNELMESYCRWIADIEQPFTLFSSTGSNAIAVGLEKFRYALTSKVPAMRITVTGEMAGTQLIVNVAWDENVITIPVEVGG